MSNKRTSDRKDSQLQPKKVADALYNDVPVEHNGWLIRINAENDTIEVFPPEDDKRHQAFETDLCHLDRAVTDFCKLAAMPIPGVNMYPKDQVSVGSPKKLLGPDSSVGEGWKNPKVNERPTGLDQKGTKGPNKNLGVDTSSQNVPHFNPPVNKRPKEPIGRGGLPETDLGPDSTGAPTNWRDRKVRVQEDGRTGSREALHEVQKPRRGPGQLGYGKAQMGEEAAAMTDGSGPSGGVVGRRSADSDPFVVTPVEEPGKHPNKGETPSDPKEVIHTEQGEGADLKDEKEGKQGRLVDSFQYPRVDASEAYRQMMAKRPSEELIRDIMDPGKWAAANLMDPLKTSAGGDVEGCSDGKGKEAAPPAGIEQGVFHGSEEAPEGARPVRGKKVAGPRLRENWGAAGEYGRDLEAESGEELHALTLALGGQEVDWSKFRPTMPAGGEGEEVAEEEAPQPEGPKADNGGAPAPGAGAAPAVTAGAYDDYEEAEGEGLGFFHLRDAYDYYTGLFNGEPPEWSVQDFGKWCSRNLRHKRPEDYTQEDMNSAYEASLSGAGSPGVAASRKSAQEGIPEDEGSGYNWDSIKKEMEKQPWVEDWQNPGENAMRGVYLGQLINPSGKYYMPWTTNQTEEDVDKDSIFWEALESEADEHGYSIESGEGDPTDTYVTEYRDLNEFSERQQEALRNGEEVYEGEDEEETDPTAEGFATGPVPVDPRQTSLPIKGNRHQAGPADFIDPNEPKSEGEPSDEFLHTEDNPPFETGQQMGAGNPLKLSRRQAGGFYEENEEYDEKSPQSVADNYINGNWEDVTNAIRGDMRLAFGVLEYLPEGEQQEYIQFVQKVASKEAVDEKAKGYWSKYFGDYGKDLTEEKKLQKPPSGGSKKKEDPKEARRQAMLRARKEAQAAAPVAQPAPPAMSPTNPPASGAAPAAPGAPAPQKPAPGAPAPGGAAPAAPKGPLGGKPLPAGTGDQGLQVLGWTAEDISLMDEADKKKILQIQLAKPGSGAKPKTPGADTKAPAPGAPAAPGAGGTPAVPSIPPSPIAPTPGPVPAGATPAVPKPTAARLSAMIQKKVDRRKALKAQVTPSQSADPGMTPPVGTAPAQQPAAPVAGPTQGPAKSAPGAAASPKQTPPEGEGSAEQKAFDILQEVQQSNVSASSPEQVLSAKVSELARRLLTEVGMTTSDAKRLFGIKADGGLDSLFQ